MSDQNDSQDFFTDTETSANSPTTAPTQPGQTVAPISGWMSRVNGLHVGLATGALGLLWVLFATSGTSSSHAGSAGAPAAGQYVDDLDVNTPAAGSSAPTYAQVAFTVASQPASAVDSAPVSPAASASSAPANQDIAQSLQALQSQVASLSAALDADRSQRAACPVPPTKPANAGPITVPTSPHRTANRVRNAAPHEVLMGYHLNTIFNGQAWIERQNQTFVVEKGVQVGGARVERIDAIARIVETDLGEIR